MTDIKIEYVDDSYVKIVAEAGITNELMDYFSFEADGFRFNPRYKVGAWDGKIRIMRYDGTLPQGLTRQVQTFASNMMYDIVLDPRLIMKPLINRIDFDKWISSLTIYSGNNVITPHWYQSDAVFHAINERKALLNLPTSAGKSLIQSLLSRWYLEQFEGKVLVIVPTTSLVTQMIDDFVDYRLFNRDNLYGIKAGVDKNAIGDRDIVVSTWQSIFKQPPEWFTQFGMLSVDECHLANGKSIDGIIKMMNQCVFKSGLSGSLKEGKANVSQYVGSFGPMFQPVSTKQLMEEGHVTNLDIKCLMLEYPDDARKAVKSKDYQEEIKFLLEHKERNQFLIKLAYNLSAKRGENTLLTFKNIKHGKLLYAALCTVHDNVHYVSGETKSDDRTSIKKLAEAEDGMIIVASLGTFSTGISIKKLHNVIFGHPTKSSVSVKQSIGRVLRKHDSKSMAVLYDIIDNVATKTKSPTAKKPYSYINYAMTHGIERIKIYASEKFDYIIRKVQL